MGLRIQESPTSYSFYLMPIKGKLLPKYLINHTQAFICSIYLYEKQSTYLSIGAILHRHTPANSYSIYSFTDYISRIAESLSLENCHKQFGTVDEKRHFNSYKQNRYGDYTFEETSGG